MRNHRVTGALTGVLAAALAFAAFAISQGPSGGTQHATSSRPEPASKSEASQAPQSVRNSYAVARASAARDASDEIPNSDGLEDLVGTHGMGIRSSKRIDAASARQLWIAPSADGVCLAHLPARAQGPGAACFDEETLAEGRAWQAYGSPDGQDGADLVALVPDGVARAMVTFSDGSSRVVPVRLSILAINTRRPVVAYSYEHQGKQRVVAARTFSG